MTHSFFRSWLAGSMLLGFGLAGCPTAGTEACAECVDDNECTVDICDPFVEDPECEYEGRPGASCDFNGQRGVCGGPDGQTCQAAETPSLTGKIAFDSDRGGGESDIFVLDLESDEDPVNLTNDPAAEDDEPAWSADGSRIAFDSDRDFNNEVYVMFADGSEPTNLTNRPARDDEPAWSPDDSQIAFDSDRDNDREIFVMSFMPMGLWQLTNNDFFVDSDAWWSPDGTKIVFRSDRNGNDEIYVMNADGSGEPVNLTNNAAADEEPSWSPDGSKIAFQSDRDGNNEIYVMDASNPSNVTRVTTDDADDEEPVWSPDSQMIAFASNRNGHFDIYAIKADGSGDDLIRLTDDPADDEDPAWTE